MTRMYVFLPLLLAAGCAWLQPAPAASPVPTATRTPVPFPEVLAQPSPAPTATFTPAPAGSQICRPVGEMALPEVSIFGDYARAFLDFLNQGGDPARIEERLEAEGMANGPNPFVKRDFTGDSRLDLAVSIVNPDLSVFPPEGRLMIFVCGLGRYELALNQSPGSEFQPPSVQMVEDLNADGLAELVISEKLCGAHTCFERIQVLNWNGAVFVGRLEGVTDDLPGSVFAPLDPDSDGIYDILITGTGIGSVGAGPQRPVLRTWRFRPGTGNWLPGEDQLAEAEFRLHALHDADAALQSGDFESALLGYQRVIEDDGLLDWQDPVAERADLSAFSHYRIVLIYTELGDTETAGEVLRQMDGAYPSGSSQRVFVEMAILFRNAHASGGLQAACNAVRGLAAVHTDTVLDPLGSLRFGYANPDYTLNELCIPG